MRQFLRPTAKRRKAGWVVLALAIVGLAATFLLFVLPFAWMPDLRDTSWHELTRGVAPGDEGAHQPDEPYFILGTNDNEPSAVATLKRKLASEGWRVYADPAPGGGITFVPTGDPDPGNVLFLGSFPDVLLSDLEDYGDASARLPEWRQHYSHIYVLQMFFP